MADYFLFPCSPNALFTLQCQDYTPESILNRSRTRFRRIKRSCQRNIRKRKIYSTTGSNHLLPPFPFLFSTFRISTRPCSCVEDPNLLSCVSYLLIYGFLFQPVMACLKSIQIFIKVT